MYAFLSLLIVLIFCLAFIALIIKDNKNNWEIEFGGKTIISIKKHNKE